MLFRTPFLFPIIYPQLVWRMPADENSLYLTFDDGPVAGPTEFALEQLNRNEARATFFCIGNNVLKNPSIFAKIRNDGHAVGNHTFSHMKGWAVPDEKYVKDIAACQEVVGETDLFRPPYGRIKRSQIKKLSKYKLIMWDVLSFDYSQSMTKERCLKGVIKAARPGSIIVLHDSYKAEKNMTYVLPRLLDHFKDKGYVFKSMVE